MWQWKVLENIEADFQHSRIQLEVMLVNAQHIKAVPGQTDVKDAQWIAELLQHGPCAQVLFPIEQRDRDPTRYRTSFIRERVLVNRIQKS